MKGYKLSMFQLMINTKSENIFNKIVNTIEEYENKLYKNKTKNKKYVKNIKIGKLKIHPPGKLQINIDKSDINEYIIGSIELKILINNKTNIKQFVPTIFIFFALDAFYFVCCVIRVDV